MKNKLSRVFCTMLTAAMTLSLFQVNGITSYAKKGSGITCDYGNGYEFEKISNPTSGSKKADGINTEDVTGYEANRINSYAWAVAARGDYIYVGTNRTLFGSALNAVYEAVITSNPDAAMTREQINNIAALMSTGDVPVNLDEQDYIPQIIRFDVKNGTSKVIYRPSTKRGEDGVLYYTDKNGDIVPGADVRSETLSYRSVVEYKGNLYFGSLGVNMLQLIRIDEDDNAEVAFQTLGQISSLRAGCIYDAGDGNGDVLYFGGQDTTYLPWRQKYGQAFAAGDPEAPLPIVIRYLDPDTAGSDQEDWSNLIATYDDFGKYANALVYKSGGGTVWDFCSYNGKLYLILAYDRGWAMFRGEKGGDAPNQFGWTWTEVVGDDGKYPLAMDENVGKLNDELAEEYGCHEYAASLNGAGLLESTATPYVYNGKMYIGTFDNATSIQSQTMIKIINKIQHMVNPEIAAANPELSQYGPSLEQIYAPIYEVLSHPQHVWVMDEDENISAVDGANELLEGTTNDYVWRFAENDGKLYTGTFDSSTAYNYFLDADINNLLLSLISNEDYLSVDIKDILYGTIIEKIRMLLSGRLSKGAGSEEEDPVKEDFIEAADEACDSLEDFNNNKATVENLIPVIENLQACRDAMVEEMERDADKGKSDVSENLKAPDEIETLSSLIELVDKILGFFDIDGLIYWAKARALVNNANSGFDLFVTSDGEKWDSVLDDGLNDPYNYGGRTLTVWNDDLYIGTANPYYGAQLWKMKDLNKHSIKVSTKGEGTAIADQVSGFPGTKVTLTAIPGKGYQFKKWVVVSGGVTVKDNQFILGDSDVQVKAVFEKIPVEPDKKDDKSPAQSPTPTPAQGAVTPTVTPAVQVTASATTVAYNLKAGETVNVNNIREKIAGWSSSNQKIARVDKNGKVTALKKGNATITATLKSGQKLDYNVTVNNNPKLSKKTITIKKGETAKVKIKGKAPEVKNKYKNTKYAKITSKRTENTIKIKGLKKGKTTLKVWVNGKLLKLKVIVK